MPRHLPLVFLSFPLLVYEFFNNLLALSSYIRNMLLFYSY